MCVSVHARTCVCVCVCVCCERERDRDKYRDRDRERGREEWKRGREGERGILPRVNLQESKDLRKEREGGWGYGQ